MILSPRACVICGTQYTPKQQRQTCCSRPCRVTMNRLTSGGRSFADTKVCPTCDKRFRPRKPEQRYCTHACGDRRSSWTAIPRKGCRTRKPTDEQGVAILPPEAAQYSSHHFTDAEFEAAYQAIRRELRAAGKPLERFDTQGFREKPRRALMHRGK